MGRLIVRNSNSPAAAVCRRIATWALAVGLLAWGTFSVAQPAESAAPGSEQTPRKITAVFNQGEIAHVIWAIAQQSGCSIELYGQAKEGRVDVMGKDLLLTGVLDRIADSRNLVWWEYDPGKYALADFETYANMTLGSGDLDKALAHLDQRFKARHEKDAEGAFVLTCPPPPKVLRGGPGAVMKPLGVENEPLEEDQDHKASLVFKEGKIEMVVTALAGAGKREIRLRGVPSGVRVSVIGKEIPVPALLDMICADANLVWCQTADGVYTISPKDYFTGTLQGNGVFERYLDALATPRAMTWRRTSTAPDGIEYRLAAQSTPSEGASAAPAPPAANAGPTPGAVPGR